MSYDIIRIQNFKAIKDLTLNLHPSFNVLVGTNGSGKSSVLQALHWMLQSGRNPEVKPEKAASNKKSTLSESKAIYMPSANYKMAGHKQEYGNTASSPEFKLTITQNRETDAASSERREAVMTIKAARNEGISVHVPSNNAIVSEIRNREREISAYIPGVAGIPLVEQRQSTLIVHRAAAAGDANTVLRNVLVRLAEQPQNESTATTKLDIVADLMRQVFGDFRIKASFEDTQDVYIDTSFTTNNRDSSFYPLELAGIGYLQSLQIFAYLIYFQPVLLLIDEPDAHLYPIPQEALVKTLAQAAREYNCQVLMTTHSPSIIRALPPDSKVHWIDRGIAKQIDDSELIRLMGWGLLGKKCLLLSEDSDAQYLNALLSQWPEFARVTAIWPHSGSNTLTQPQPLESLTPLLGNDIKFIIHRDRDFFMDPELELIKKEYSKKGISFWFTKHTDIEAYWCSAEVIKEYFQIPLDEATKLLEQAVKECQTPVDNLAKHVQVIRNKRSSDMKNLRESRTVKQYGEDEVLASFEEQGFQYSIVGKTLQKEIRKVASEKNLRNASRFGKSIPPSLPSPLAEDLRQLLEEVIPL